MWTCSKCREELEDSFDSCWSCGTVRGGARATDAAVLQKHEREAAAPEAAACHDEQTPKDFLQAVRAQTCYQALRGLIDVCSVFAVLITIIAGISFLGSGMSDSDGSIAVSLVGAAITAICCVLIVAARQSSLLLIDIADTLIEQNRKRRKKR